MAFCLLPLQTIWARVGLGRESIYEGVLEHLLGHRQLKRSLASPGRFANSPVPRLLGAGVPSPPSFGTPSKANTPEPKSPRSLLCSEERFPSSFLFQSASLALPVCQPLSSRGTIQILAPSSSRPTLLQAPFQVEI